MSVDNMLFLERLKHILLDPVDLRRNFLIMLKTHFMNPEHYGPAVELKDIYYKVSPEGGQAKDSPLTIKLGHVKGNENSDINETSMPVILVHNTDWTFQQRDVGNLMDRNPEDGSEVYRKVVDTNLVVQHFSGSADNSLMLATQTAAFVGATAEHIKKAWSLDKFELTNLTSPKLTSNSSAEERIYQVDVSVKLNFNFVWTAYTDNKLIKTISFLASKEL